MLFRSISVLRMKKDRDVPEGFPYWYEAESSFLPGRNSVAANAISLAVLMRAALVVLVGVDLEFIDERYYASGVRRNPGPKNQFRALSASRAWMKKAAQRGVWEGPAIITTSPTLSLRGVKRVSVKEAVMIAHTVTARGRTA